LLRLIFRNNPTMTIAEFHAHLREARRKVEQTLADRYGEQPPRSTGDRKRAQALNHWKNESTKH
jgi:hypothetical protein